jgi:hypothetical protein
MKNAYIEDGYYLLKSALNEDVISTLKDELSEFDGKINNYGVRSLINKVPYVKDMAYSSPLIDIAKKVLGENARPVRSVYFDKVIDANWNVAWHQDTSIALKSSMKQ